MEGISRENEQLDTKACFKEIDEPDSDFYMNISGGKLRNEVFEDNTDSDFSYQFPQRLHFPSDKDWECALTEVAYPEQWQTLPECSFHLSIVLDDDTWRQDPLVTTYTLPAGNYMSAADLVDNMNSMLTNHLLKKKSDSTCKYNMDISKLVKFQYLPAAKRVSISYIQDDRFWDRFGQKVTHAEVHFDNILSDAVGFHVRPDIATSHLPKPRTIRNVPLRMHRFYIPVTRLLCGDSLPRLETVLQTPSITFSMDSIESEYFMGKQRKMLDNVYSKKHKSHLVNQFVLKKRQYKSLIPGIYSSFRFSLRKLNGKAVNFTQLISNGAQDISLQHIYMKLHIRPRRKNVFLRP